MLNPRLRPHSVRRVTGVLLAPFAEYLRSFTDDSASAGAADRQGRRRLPFLRRSLPPSVRPQDINPLQRDNISTASLVNSVPASHL